MDLFEEIREALGCEYISDIRIGTALRDARRIVAQKDLTAYSVRELADISEYLYGKEMYEAEKSDIITFLRNGYTERPSKKNRRC